ncbi:hypothetical protein ACYOEI_12070 [Singulisphaera rosea]
MQFIILGGKSDHRSSFRFHHSSEHQVDAKRHTIELYVVHQNIDDGSLAVERRLLGRRERRQRQEWVRADPHADAG